MVLIICQIVLGHLSEKIARRYRNMVRLALTLDLTSHWPNCFVCVNRLKWIVFRDQRMSVGGGEIIHLNVGGTKFSTSRQTLTTISVRKCRGLITAATALIRWKYVELDPDFRSFWTNADPFLGTLKQGWGIGFGFGQRTGTVAL